MSTDVNGADAGRRDGGLNAPQQTSTTPLTDMFSSEFLFDASPVPSMLQDWGPVWDWMDAQRSAGVTDLAAVLADDPELVVDIVSRVRILAVNRAFLSLERVTEESLVGSHFRKDAVRRELALYRQHLLDQWNGIKTPSLQHVTRSRSGREVVVTVRYAQDPDRRGLRLVTAQDFTDAARVEESLRDVAIAKDRFVASVAHELRTPMTAVVGFATELELRLADLDESERSEIISILARESREVAAIVDDLLVAARADIGGLALRSEPVALAQAAHDVIAGLGSDTTVLADGETVVVGDVVRVRQIIRNLVTNAVRYGGTKCWVRVSADGGTGSVQVRDNGEGVPADYADQIFQPYGQANSRNAVSGSVGLGLSVARQLARAMGGELSMIREDGETVFNLGLPVWQSGVQDGSLDEPNGID